MTTRTETIVVGVDGSFNSGAALDWAVADAQRRNAGVRIVHVVWVPITVAAFGDASTFPPPDDLMAYGEEVLTTARERVASQAPDVHVETSLLVRRPDEALLEAAQEASLVVVGTRGLGGLGALALGSVSGKVAASAPCPTVVVPPDVVPSDGPVVVGVDGSEPSDAALQWAMTEAALRGVDVVALNAYQVSVLPMPIIDADTMSKVAAEDRRRAVEQASQAVDRARRAVDVDVAVTVHVEAGHPADVLLDHGRDAALVVVGSRGLGKFRGLLLGSISQAVLHQATRPVAVVRAPDEPA